MIFPMNAPMFDLLILSVTAQGDSYGYQISQKIKKVSNTKDSTLYPILKRLQEQGFLSAYDQPFQGRNRRYYKITRAGLLHYEMLLSEWDAYQKAVGLILKGEDIS